MCRLCRVCTVHTLGRIQLPSCAYYIYLLGDVFLYLYLHAVWEIDTGCMFSGAGAGAGAGVGAGDGMGMGMGMGMIGRGMIL